MSLSPPKNLNVLFQHNWTIAASKLSFYLHCVEYDFEPTWNQIVSCFLLWPRPLATDTQNVSEKRT